MRQFNILVSKQNLTRCHSCSRHHKLDSEWTNDELSEQSCIFCGGQLITRNTQSAHHTRLSRSSRLALGLLSASLTFGACDDEDEVINNSGSDGSVAGTQVAGEVIDQPVYGAPAAGIEFEEGSTQIAGEVMDQPVYGAPAAGHDN
jgi:hypothetical protein